MQAVSSRRRRNLNVVAHHVALAMSHGLRVRLELVDGTAAVGRVVRRVNDVTADPQESRTQSSLRVELDSGETVRVQAVERVARA